MVGRELKVTAILPLGAATGNCQ